MVTFCMARTHVGTPNPRDSARVAIDSSCGHTLWSVHDIRVTASISSCKELRSTTLAAPRVRASCGAEGMYGGSLGSGASVSSSTSLSFSSSSAVSPGDGGASDGARGYGGTGPSSPGSRRISLAAIVNG